MRRVRNHSVPRRQNSRHFKTPKRAKTPFPRTTPRHTRTTPRVHTHSVEMPRPLPHIPDNRAKLHLFVQYYHTHDCTRQAELDFCLLINVQHAPFDKIFVLSDQNDVLPEQVARNAKMCVVPVKSRPTFDDVISVVNQNTDENSVNVICNSDICFDSSVDQIRWLRNDEALNISRWDVTRGVQALTFDTLRTCCRAYHSNDSFDVWAVRGAYRKPVIGQALFAFGIPGCDNRFAWILQQAGYKVHNPCKSIYCYHVHTSNIRSYTFQTARVPGPYAHVTPCHWPV